MSAPSKRRRAPYYLSLPVVITALFLLVAKLVAMQRAEIIAELSDRVEHREPEDASAAVRQLGDMPRPPAAVLVAAASAADRQVAREAQQAIDRLLRRMQQQLEAGRRVKGHARQLSELARDLATHRHAFPVADQAWLVRTAQRILRLANQVPQKHAPVVAANCDLILTSIPTATSAAAQQAVPQGAPGQISPGNKNPVTAETREANSLPEEGEQAGAIPNDLKFAPWRAERSPPAFRALPFSTDTPVDSSPSPSPLPQSPAELPPDMELIGRPMANAETRTLLQKWHDMLGLTPLEQQLQCVESFVLEVALMKRGFDRPPAMLIQKLFSTPQDRLQLVDDVLEEPGINARPWLVLLAEDVDAEVRLAALTIMATSSDVALVEQAWQAAIHDRDPRVAALANRLRERRAAIQRR